MKIRRVQYNNHRKAFEVTCGNRVFHYPYSRLRVRPSGSDVVRDASVDRDWGKQSFTYVLRSGIEGTVHVDHVLEYNAPPARVRTGILDELVREARDRAEQSPLSRREVARRLGTSASQLYRILDHGNYRKSVDQVLALLEVLECDVDVTVKRREPAPLCESADGVDVSLIRWTLSLTPAERLRALQQHVDSVIRIRNGQTRG